MADWLAVIAFERGMALRSPVSIEAAYFALLAHQDWIGRQEWVWELAMGTRSVLGQLKSANGDKPPAKLGSCTECNTGALVLLGGLVACQSCSFATSAADLLAHHFDADAAA